METTPIFSMNAWQFASNKVKEYVETHDHLRSEVRRHFKINKKIFDKINFRYSIKIKKKNISYFLMLYSVRKEIKNIQCYRYQQKKKINKEK